MKRLLTILYRTSLLKLTTNKVSRWVKNGNIDNLIMALEYGIYDVRKGAIEGLTTLKHKESIPLLEKYLDDSIQSVSESAIEGLTILTNEKNSIINEKIKQKKQYWKAKKANKKKIEGSYISNLSFRNQEKESPSQRLERRFKQQRDTNHPPFGF
jgi:HEAT repeat protein